MQGTRAMKRGRNYQWAALVAVAVPMAVVMPAAVAQVVEPSEEPGATSVTTTTSVPGTSAMPPTTTESTQRLSSEPEEPMETTTARSVEGRAVAPTVPVSEASVLLADPSRIEGVTGIENLAPVSRQKAPADIEQTAQLGIVLPLNKYSANVIYGIPDTATSSEKLVSEYTTVYRTGSTEIDAVQADELGQARLIIGALADGETHVFERSISIPDGVSVEPEGEAHLMFEDDQQRTIGGLRAIRAYGENARILAVDEAVDDRNVVFSVTGAAVGEPIYVVFEFSSSKMALGIENGGL